MVSSFVEYNVRKLRFSTLGMAQDCLGLLRIA